VFGSRADLDSSVFCGLFGGAFLILGRHDMPSFLGMSMGMGGGC
jgi:hypothetical protein